MSDISKDKRVVLKGGKVLDKICPKGMDYCWECGHIDEPEIFLHDDLCPNPDCPNPQNWDDSENQKYRNKFRLY